MNLSERLNEDMKQAMKNQDKFKLSTIRMVRATMKNLEIDLKRTLNDNEVLDILSREIKQRKDALQEFEKAGRDDLAAQVKAEAEILAEYLPEQLTEEEIK
ncbi:MAG: GatB/YqeY domain-containing protein, partial [Paenibacillus macerans]|nr:GatB/YqeY domain-containing protein [Paenibacillus macerans]